MIEVDDKHTQQLEHTLIRRTFMRFLAHYPNVYIYPFLALALFWHDFHSPVTLLLWTLAAIALYAWRQVVYRKTLKRIDLEEDPDTNSLWRVMHIAGFVSGLIWGFAGFAFYTPNNLFVVAAFYVLLLGLLTSNVLMHSLPLTRRLPERPIMLFSIPVAVAVGARVYLSVGLTESMIYTVIVGLYFFAFFNISRSFLNDELNLLQVQAENETLIQKLSIKTAEAERANTEKSKFLAAASHDLRQPLHAMGLFMFALGDEVSSPKGREVLSKLKQSNEDMVKLFDALLDLSRLDAGVVTVHREVFDLGVLLKELHDEFAPQAEAKNLQLESHYEDATIIYNDRVLLRNILVNLLSNAIRYTDSGHIRLEVKAIKNKPLQITVSDTGIGIPAHEVENVFSEYHQLNNPERDRNKGLGLGLSIVKRICALLEIELNLASVENGGSAFHLSFDTQCETEISPAPLNSSQPIYDASLPVSNKCVLVIDDDVNILQGMQMLFQSFQWQSLVAPSIVDALALLKKHEGTIDCLVTDYRLRENTTGLDAIKAVREMLGHEVPAIIITGDTKIHQDDAVASNFEVLHKPVDQEKLYQTICMVSA